MTVPRGLVSVGMSDQSSMGEASGAGAGLNSAEKVDHTAETLSPSLRPAGTSTPGDGSPTCGSPQPSGCSVPAQSPFAPQFHSPRRARGPAAPTVSQSHESAQGKPGWGLQDASTTLFGLFRRPSMSSEPHNRPSLTSSRASINESIYGGLDRMAAPARLATPVEAKKAGDLAAAALESARTYSAALDAASTAAARFGASLDACSRTKPAEGSVAGLQQAGGFHLLVSNHLHILKSSLDERFAAPLARGVGAFRTSLAEYEQAFQTELRSRNAALRESEAAASRRARRRGRRMLDYRSALLDVTAQIDEISRLKLEFLGDMHVLAAELDEHLVRHLAGLVHAQIEIFDSIARKGWSGGGLDSLLAGCPDPFREADEDEADEDDEDGAMAGTEPVAEQNNSNRSGNSNTSSPGPGNDTGAPAERLTPPNGLFSLLANGASILPAPRADSDDEAADLTVSTRASEASV